MAGAGHFDGCLSFLECVELVGCGELLLASRCVMCGIAITSEERNEVYMYLSLALSRQLTSRNKPITSYTSRPRRQMIQASRSRENTFLIKVGEV